MLAQLGVHAAARCGLPAYDGRSLDAAGNAVLDLAWDDGVPPPIHIAAKFLALQNLNR